MNSINSSATKYTNLVLYSYFRSSSSWRVRIAMNLKNIKYEIKPTHLVKGENKTDDFGKINPIKKIPLLQFEVIDENSQKSRTDYIPESMAICEFLEEAFPESEVKLLPQDLLLRAKVRAFCSQIACNIQPIQNLPVLNRVQELGVDKKEWAQEWISKGLDTVEIMLGMTKGKYCFGDTLTLADAFLVPQLFNARRFGVDMKSYVNILEVESNLNSLEAFKAAQPENQIDFEPNK